MSVVANRPTPCTSTFSSSGGGVAHPAMVTHPQTRRALMKRMRRLGIATLPRSGPGLSRSAARRLASLASALGLHMLGQLGASGLAVPALVLLGSDLTADQQRCEFTALGFALERHIERCRRIAAPMRPLRIPASVGHRTPASSLSGSRLLTPKGKPAMGARGGEVGERIEKTVPGHEEEAATARTRLLQDGEEVQTEASAGREIEKQCDDEHRGRDRRVAG